MVWELLQQVWEGSYAKGKMSIGKETLVVHNIN